jgi:hypothetical protein
MSESWRSTPMLRGVGLPADLLEKVYHSNAERMLRPQGRFMFSSFQGHLSLLKQRETT